MDHPVLSPRVELPRQQVLRAPLGVVLGWGTGSIGAAVVLLTYNMLMLRFLTDYVGISAVAAGTMIAISKIFDAAIDPLIGAYSDRLHSPMGRRRPFLLASAVLCPLTMLALFYMPQFASATVATIYVFVILQFYAFTYAVWSVPYMAMAAEITDDYRDRSRLMAYRFVAGNLGQVLTSTGGPWLLVYWGNGREAYQNLGATFALVIAASCLLCFFATRKARIVEADVSPPISSARQIQLGWENRPFRYLICSKFFFFGLSATALTSNTYFTKYVLKMSDVWLGLFYLILTVGAVVTIPVWLWAGRVIDKKYACVLGISLVGIVDLTWLLVQPTEPTALMWLRAFLNGVGLTGFVIFSQSMLPDTVEYDYQRTGMRREGLFAGIFVLVEKISTAGGIALIGLFIGLTGYIEAGGNALVEQPASAIWGIRISFAVLPAVGAFFSVLLLLPYDLDERKLKAMAPRGPDV